MSNKEKHTFSSGSKKKDFLKLHSDLVSADRAILIHIGNKPIDIMGCLLPGGPYGKDSVDSSGVKVKNIENVVKSLYGGNSPALGANVLITVIIKNEFEMEE